MFSPKGDKSDVAPSWALIHLLASLGVPLEYFQANLQMPPGDSEPMHPFPPLTRATALMCE